MKIQVPTQLISSAKRSQQGSLPGILLDIMIVIILDLVNM